MGASSWPTAGETSGYSQYWTKLAPVNTLNALDLVLYKLVSNDLHRSLHNKNYK